MTAPKSRRLTWAYTLVVFMALLLASPAWSDILTPGSSGAPDSLTQGTFTVDASTLVQSWSTANASGRYVEEVGTDTGNTFCPTCLDFLIAVGDNSTSTASVQEVTAALFGGFQTDVGIASSQTCSQGSPGNDPSLVDRSGGPGNAIDFNWVGLIGQTTLDPGYCSVLIIETDATAFTAGTVTITDTGNATDTVSGYAPVSAPEPSSLLLLGMGFAGLFGLAYWKSAALRFGVRA